MCKRKKREEGKRWVKRVKEARTESQVWEIINRRGREGKLERLMELREENGGSILWICWEGWRVG